MLDVPCSQAEASLPYLEPGQDVLSLNLFDFNQTGNGLQGYAWDFPARVGGSSHHNRGVYDSRVARKRKKAGLNPILKKTLDGMGNAPDQPKVEGHPIRWFSPRNQISGSHLLLELWEDGYTVWMSPLTKKPVVVTPAGQMNPSK